MTTANRGAANTLAVEWREFQGGPYAVVTGVTITITPLAGGSPVLATTSSGVTNPGAGINVYVWTPATDLPVGSYLVEWSGTDPQADVIGAAEIITVTAGAALGGPYADRATLKRRQLIPDSNTVSDTDIDDALRSASNAINRYCSRQFGQDAEPSERSFAAGPTGVDVDDFWTTDDLLISGAAWSFTSYALEPTNGIQDGVPGWPYRRICSPVGAWAYASAVGWGSATVLVSARWGWAEVPEDIVQACLLLAADSFKAKDAPFGVAGFGDYVVRVRANPKVQELLNPYRRDPVMAA